MQNSMCLYRATELEPIHFRQHKIQNEQAGTQSFGIGNQIRHFFWTMHIKTRQLQVVRYQAGDVFLVFDENYEFLGLFSHRFDWV